MEANQRNTDDDRGQVGIGTLIVFIAMVLVAAIAAGVLINTAGFLQSQSEETGEQSSQQVTDRVQVTSVTGSVSGSTIDGLDLNVKKAPGAGDIDLDQATIQWVGPSGTADLTSAHWSLTPVSGGNPLTDSSDVVTIELTLDGSSVGGADVDDNPAALSTGAEATLELTTASGGTTTVFVSVPDSLSGSSAVSL